MASQKIIQVSGRALVIRGNDIDTDRIIPARFLKEITFANLGNYPFYDERFNIDGSEKLHPMNDPQNQNARILIVNKNFGCGSSREHAPQALKRWGIDAIIGESFAEIFASNCSTIGIPALRVSEQQAQEIQDIAEGNPSLIWQVNLDPVNVSTEGFSAVANIPDHYRNALVNGLWDSTSLLLDNSHLVKNLSKELPYMNDYQTGS